MSIYEMDYDDYQEMLMDDRVGDQIDEAIASRNVSPEYSLDADYHRSREDVASVELVRGGLLIRRKNSYTPRFEGVTGLGRVRYHTRGDVVDFLQRVGNRSF
jgi:hypothetical protein